MKEEGSWSACFEKEFQIRSFVPPTAKWSPFLFSDCAASRAIISLKATFVVFRVVSYFVGAYIDRST